jgi:hypothetical protein
VSAEARKFPPEAQDTGASDAQRLVQQLAELRVTEMTLRGLSEAVPPLLDVLSKAQALAEEWSSWPKTDSRRD